MLNKRITPENITILKNNEYFVFGSNIQGIHGKGAALQAKKFWAVFGKYTVCVGDNTYAIPTKDLSNNKAVPLSIIQKYVNEFIKFANANKNIIFLVTPIGCGLEEYKCKDIAPLFKEAININNIYLPKSFWEVLD